MMKTPQVKLDRFSLPAGLGGGMTQGFILALLVSAVAFFAFQLLGTVGLVYVAGGILGGILLLSLAIRIPVLIFILWLVSISGLQTLGMLRMPGLPDFSYHRLLLIALLVLMLGGLVQGRAIIKRPYLPDVFVILYTFYVLANQQTIGDPKNFNLWYLSSFSPMIGYFFAKQFIEKDVHIKLLMWSIFLVTAYFWYISIMEHFGLDALVWPKSILADQGRWVGRSRGPFLQPALFGQLLGMYLLLHLYLLTQKSGVRTKLLVGSNLALGAVGLLYTFTRGGWLATLAGLVILGFMRPMYRKVLIGLVVAGIFLGGLGLFQATNDEMLRERVENKGTVENRFAIMASAFNAIKQNPFVGVGYFRFKDEAYLYKTGVYVPFYGYVAKKRGASGSIHDIYVGRTAEEGLVGISLFFGFLFAVVQVLIKRWREDPPGAWFNRDFLAVVTAVCGAYLLGGLFFDYRFFDLVNVIPYVLAGIVVGFPDVRGAEKSSDNHPRVA